jgi:hypothetical protein
MCRISGLAEQLSALQEELCFMELVGYARKSETFPHLRNMFNDSFSRLVNISYQY